MKKILFLLIVLVAGLGLGGGAAFATMLALGPRHVETAAEKEADDDAKASFVPTGKILAPLVFADGHLAGYVQFDVQLEVAEDKAEFVTDRLPLLLHAINMRTYRTPMAAAPDGMLPDLEVFRKLVLQASREAFGAAIVRKVAVTAASPA